MFTQKITTSTTLTVPESANDSSNAGVICEVDSTGGAITITLPAISSFPGIPRYQVNVVDTGGAAATNNITVACNAADLINNAASVVLNQNGGVLIIEITSSTDWTSIDANGGLPIVARTATADGLTTGTIANGNVFVQVTSANANNIIVLPAAIPGTRVNLRNGATGYELRTSSPTTIAINGGTGAAAESAIAANTYVEMICDTTGTWIGRQYDTAGAQTSVQVAAP